MKQTYLMLVFLCLGYTSNLVAQEYDLNDLRQVPERNSLPVRQPQLRVVPVSIPEQQLDLRINYWRNWTAFGINANQASFSDNWQAGGVNSIALGSSFNTKFDYTRESKTFLSELDLRYGVVQNKDQLRRKTNDRILWDNKYSIKFSPKWSFFASFAFESQFDRGYTYGLGASGQDSVLSTISNFMAPGYFTESIGVEVQPDKSLSIRFGTGTARQTFVFDDNVLPNATTRFGIPTVPLDSVGPGARRPGRFRNELAFQLVSNLDRNFGNSLNLKARYAFFANYEDLGNASHRLDATLTAKVTRVISVTMNTVVFYDPLQDLGVQTAQSLAIGLLYNFPR